MGGRWEEWERNVSRGRAAAVVVVVVGVGVGYIEDGWMDGVDNKNKLSQCPS